jgi:hypothetical protein
MSLAVFRFGIVVVAAVALGGCVAAGIEAASAGVGSAVDAGFGESRTGAVVRTFTAPIEEVRTATVAALERMAFDYREEPSTADGRKLVARSGNHDVQIELARLSPNATRLRVLADGPGIFAKDAATGQEIVQQTARALAAR